LPPLPPGVRHSSNSFSVKVSPRERLGRWPPLRTLGRSRCFRNISHERENDDSDGMGCDRCPSATLLELSWSRLLLPVCLSSRVPRRVNYRQWDDLSALAYGGPGGRDRILISKVLRSPRPRAVRLERADPPWPCQNQNCRHCGRYRRRYPPVAQGPIGGPRHCVGRLAGSQIALPLFSPARSSVDRIHRRASPRESIAPVPARR
jgi:hypothetical protein